MTTMNTVRRCLTAAVCFSFFILPSLASDLEILEGPVSLRSDANGAVGASLLRINNKNTKPLKISLRAGEWTNNLTDRLMGPALLFSLKATEKGSAELVQDLPAGITKI